MGDNENRNLTDADVEAITKALHAKVVEEFYQDLGRGVWALVWRGLVIAVIAIAAFGAGKGHFG